MKVQWWEEKLFEWIRRYISFHFASRPTNKELCDLSELSEKSEVFRLDRLMNSVPITDWEEIMIKWVNGAEDLHVSLSIQLHICFYCKKFSSINCIIAPLHLYESCPPLIGCIITFFLFFSFSFYDIDAARGCLSFFQLFKTFFFDAIGMK